MAASQEYMDKALLRRSYRNVWQTDLTCAIQADFPFSLIHASLSAFQIRVLRRVHAMQRQSFMFCLQQLACICSLVACIVGNQELSEASQAISCVSDAVYWTVCSCMQTQHKVEMDKRDGKLGGAAMTVPPTQQMSRIDQPMPPQDVLAGGALDLLAGAAVDGGGRDTVALLGGSPSVATDMVSC
uniref:Uncharacterized protein n=1 Tax=Aegilops tauschii TaxID=37682 RepID=M8C009_AEGTA